MVYLHEPDGTKSMAIERESAIKFCAENPGWSWSEIDDLEDEPDMSSPTDFDEYEMNPDDCAPGA